jgi:hypothetical protein
MKNYIIILFVLLVASQAASAKKDKKDSRDATIDSLTITNKNLSAKADSLSTELDKVYLVVKERIVKRDFDKSKIPQAIDSIAMQVDSVLKGFRSSSTTLMDSLTILKKENVKLKATIDGIVSDETGKNRIVAELRTLKELLDAKILTQSEFDVKKTKILEKW